MRLSREQSDIFRSLRALWLTASGGVAAMLLGALFIRFLRSEPWMHGSDALFYSCAFLNLGCLIYALHTRGRARQFRPDDLTQRLVHAYHVSRRTLLPMTAAALVAIFPLAVTEMWVTALFLVPFFGFVLVFFPYERRFS